MQTPSAQAAATLGALLFREVEFGDATFRQTVALREKTLVKPLKLSLTEEELAAERDSYHLAAFDTSSEQVVGCLVLKPLPDGAVQMRQVAVSHPRQGAGVGRKLVEYSEALAREKGYAKMCMHARMRAVPFYVKQGYEIVGERFEEVGIPHYRMVKKL